MPLRIAAIEFLNAAPLMWGLEADARFSMYHTLPSACAAALQTREADLGVIPAIELARAPGIVGLEGLGVASGSGEHCAVRSILLISRVAPERIRTIALDRASRTSAALAQILLRQRFGAPASAVEGDRDWRAGLARADAVLLIGDPALRLRVSGEAEAEGCQVFDLAQTWWDWTGLPFVFAVWGVRADVLPAHRHWLVPRLHAALAEGLASRLAMANAWAPRLQLPVHEVLRYLRDNVVYGLTAAHRAGLDRFLALAAEERLIPQPAAEFIA